MGVEGAGNSPLRPEPVQPESVYLVSDLTPEDSERWRRGARQPESASTSYTPAAALQSEQNFTPDQPEATQTPQAQPAPRADDGFGNLAAAARSYLSGSRRYVPERVVLAGEQWVNRGETAMPGRSAKETAANQQAYNAAKGEREEIENEALVDQRLALQDKSDREFETSVSEYVQGQGYADRQRQIVSEQEQKKAAVADRLAKLDRIIDQQSQVSSSNPVNDYWKNRTLGERTVDAVSLGLGAIGQALTGAPNVALEIINRQIDGEVMKQRATVDTLGHKMLGQRMALAALQDQFMSPEAADSAMRAAMMGQVESFYREQAARERSAEAKQAVTGVADALAAQRAAEKQKALSAEHVKQMEWKPATVVGDAGGMKGVQRMIKDYHLDEKQAQQLTLAFAQGGARGAAEYLGKLAGGAQVPIMSKDELASRKFERDTRIVVPPEFGGGEAWATDDMQKKGAQEGLRQSSQLLQSIGRLRKMVHSGSRLSPTDRAFVDQIAATSAGSWRVNLGLGVMSESDKDLIRPLTGGFINDLALADREKVLANIESLVRQSAEGYMGELYADPTATTLRKQQIKRAK